jgi:hypothetical protein
VEHNPALCYASGAYVRHPYASSEPLRTLRFRCSQDVAVYVRTTPPIIVASCLVQEILGNQNDLFYALSRISIRPPLQPVASPSDGSTDRTSPESKTTTVVGAETLPR